MYICICHAVTEKQISAAIDDGESTMRALRRRFDLCTACGKCGPTVRGMLAGHAPPARDKPQAATAVFAQLQPAS